MTRSFRILLALSTYIPVGNAIHGKAGILTMIKLRENTRTIASGV